VCGEEPVQSLRGEAQPVQSLRRQESLCRQESVQPLRGFKPLQSLQPLRGAKAPDLTVAEATAVYGCMQGEMRATYAKSGVPAARAYRGWPRYSTTAYKSDAHGLRFVQTYSNAKSYGKY
jgi:hypothetical protein